MSALLRRSGPEKDTPPPEEERSGAENLMLENVKRMNDMRVADAMVPRADIVAIAEDSSLEEILAVFRQANHSRLPVYRETLDDPIGFIHVKDLFFEYGFQETKTAAFEIRRHIRNTLMVPPSMRISVLLQRMQAKRVHMALVIDEYGGVDGLVTFEDLVEMIVGDIEDEHDQNEDVGWEQRPDGSYLCDARADISDFFAATGVRLLDAESEEEVDTLGGLVFMLCGRVPERGEALIHPDGHEIVVADADARRIKRLIITLAGDVKELQQAAQ